MIRIVILYATIISLSFLIVGCSSPDENANELYVNAMLILKEAKQAESTSYSDAFKLYSSVIDIIDTIISKYPSTSLAVKLAHNDERIGQYTYDDYKNIFLKQFKVKADAEDAPLFCSFLVAKSIPHDSMKKDVLLKIAQAYANTGNTTMANDILDNDIDFVCPTPNNNSFKEWANSLLGTSGVVSDIINISSIYNISKNSHKAIKGIETAIELVNYIATTETKIASLNEIASFYKKLADRHKVLAIASQATDIYNNANNNAYALANIANIYISGDDNRSALQIASQAYSIALSHKGPFSPLELKLIAIVYASAGAITKAIDVANAITSDDTSKYLATKDIAIIIAQQGSIDKSIDLANSITIAGIKLSALVAIGEICAESNKQSKALDLASQAFELSKSFDSFPHDASTLAQVSALYTKAGEKEKAIYTLSLALDKVKHAATEYTKCKSSRTHGDDSEDTIQLFSLANSLIEIGKCHAISGITLDINAKHILHLVIDVINN